MKRLIDTFFATTLFALSPVTIVDEAEAGINVQNKQCQRLYAQWKTKPGHRAFAVSQSAGVAVQGCGGVWNAPSKAAAEQEAIKACRGAKAMAATCAVMESR
jgi:hypothetical protein